MQQPYPPRGLRVRDNREVTLRTVAATDGDEIIQAFERLSSDARYNRFMQHKKQIVPAALERGVNPQPGRDFVLLATVPAADGIDIVGGAQYVLADNTRLTTCEFAITVAEDWRGTGLATELMKTLLHRAPHDGYTTMEGSVIAANIPMLALARKLGFEVQRMPGDATVVLVTQTLEPALLGDPGPVNPAADTAATLPPSDQ